MFTHCVFFWCKDGLTAEQTARFEKGVRTLTGIPSVVHGAVGTPAATNRPVIDRSYQYGLLVQFKDLKGHDEYQVHPIHDAFHPLVAECCKKVLVYDYE